MILKGIIRNIFTISCTLAYILFVSSQPNYVMFLAKKKDGEGKITHIKRQYNNKFRFFGKFFMYDTSIFQNILTQQVNPEGIGFEPTIFGLNGFGFEKSCSKSNIWVGSGSGQLAAYI